MLLYSASNLPRAGVNLSSVRVEPGPTVKAAAARYFNLLYSAQNGLSRAL